MEESKQLQNAYTIFKASIYILLLLEFCVFIPFGFVKNTEWLYFIISKISRFGIYESLIYSKLAIFMMTTVTAIGTVPRKDLEFDPQRQVVIPFIIGLFAVLLAVYCYPHVASFKLFELPANFIAYLTLSVIGTVAIHLALDNISKFIKHGLMRDRMNWENESFEQEKIKIENKDSVNIPTLFYYKGKMNNGWINIEQPFRGTWVVGVPGSGKTFGIIEPMIRQQAAKGYSMAVYDYKFPTLARKLFYHFEKNKLLGNFPKESQFNIINFVDVEYSRRVNPIQNRYIRSVGEASETAVTLMEALQKGGKSGGGGAEDFFKKSAENFLAACIFFFVNYKVTPYDKSWNELKETKRNDEATNQEITEYIDDDGVVQEVYRWKGKYADLPHVLSFLLEEYTTIFDVLLTDDRVASLIAPFQTALKNKATDQLEGMVGTLRVYVSRLVTPEAYFVLSGDDFDLKISDPNNPSYLLIANDPQMEAIITALNAVILNRLVSEVNTGEGKNNPVSIIVDELPTLYFNKIDRLQGTARSNKVAVTLGFQSKEQLEKDYGKEVAAALLNIFGNVVCAASCAKDTVEWLSNDIFGKIKQIKKGVSITRNDTTISLNEEMQPLVPPDKISSMPAGWMCGATAKSFREMAMDRNGKVNIEKNDEFKPSKFFAKTNFDMEAIEREEKMYKELPKFYTFANEYEKQDALMSNYRRIGEEVKSVCAEILNLNGNSI